MTDAAYDAEAVRGRLKTSWLGQGDRLIFREEIDSTNDEVKRMAEKGAPEGLLIFTDCQSKGKGRRGRTWTAPPGVNIAMSYLLRPELPPDRASMLTIIMALACDSALKSVTGLQTAVKWPNDIVYNGKKLTGILTEMVPENGRIKYLVIGTGINVNTEDFPEEIRDRATSLFLETGSRISRTRITAECAGLFEKYYEVFLRDGDLSALKDEYNGICLNTGQRVRVLDPKGEYEGKALGINNEGSLIVERDEGSLEEVFSGEVSVRGVYGYAV